MMHSAALNNEVSDTQFGAQAGTGPGTSEAREIESRLCMNLLVGQCAVVGEREDYYAALLVPDKYCLGQYLQGQYPGQEFRLDGYHRINHIDIRTVFCDLIESINASLGGKRIERFALLEVNRRKTRDDLCSENRAVIDSLFQDYIPGVG